MGRPFTRSGHPEQLSRHRKNLSTYDFDLLVVGHQTEGALAAVAAGRAGAAVGLVIPQGRLLGGLLTEGGLAYVDRDSRHLRPYPDASQDGLFGEFLTKAGVKTVSLDPGRGSRTLLAMLRKARVVLLEGDFSEPRIETERLCALRVAASEISARFFLDATPDGDLLEALGEPFSWGFSEFGTSGLLGVSPLPVVRGVARSQIVATCEALGRDSELESRQREVFGDRVFLELEEGPDYLLIGPPRLALRYQIWRDRLGISWLGAFSPDGFNVALLRSKVSSWNGLIYCISDPQTLMNWSRQGADEKMRAEVGHFGRFLREGLGWSDAEVTLGGHGMYVRQTRHALGTCLRFSLGMIAEGKEVRNVGTFCYYPDFRGWRPTPKTGPLVARVALDAGLLRHWRNVGIASRAGGYTPAAHSLCRLVQYNATLGAGLGVAVVLAESDDWKQVPDTEIRRALAELQLLANDDEGLDETPARSAELMEDELIRQEVSESRPLPG